MHVIFISQCEKKSLKKTRTLLDGYANRIGDTSWATPITTESLEHIKKALKRTATRQTAVACYRNYGLRKMRLLWTVGNSKTFGKNGEIAVSTRTVKINTKPINWLNHACLVAKLSGVGHDIGKIYDAFQFKINKAAFNPGIETPQALKDMARHEIISAVILSRMLGGQNWNEAWTNIILNKHASDLSFIKGAIDNYEKAILFSITTHHRLFGGHKEDLTLANHLKLNKDICEVTVRREADRNTENIKKITESLVAKIALKKGASGFDCSANYWQSIALIARAGLILADHKISSQKLFLPDNKEVFANTQKENGNIKLNQTLSWHLSHVGREAGQMVRRMALLDAPGLSLETMDNLTRHTSSDHFDWQNKAAAILTPDIPHLVFNVAATGTGKTRMNLRAAAVLTGDQALRATVVLNLRSLTLQTGRAFRNELHIKGDELAVIQGSQAVRKMHAYESADIDYRDLVESEERESSLLDDDADFDFGVPEWLEANCKTKASRAVVTAPLLVATTDYLINAADPRRQAQHAVALLRIMHSDLIIDEIDSYEPSALAGLIRLIKLSAIFGRHVIVSSATLQADSADLIHQSYQAGFRIYQEMNALELELPEFNVAIINDAISPLSCSNAAFKDASFHPYYRAHIKQMMTHIKTNTVITKKAKIIKFEKSEAAMHQAIAQAANNLHEDHKWRINQENKQSLSFGLVRVANIKHAIKVAKNLSGAKDTFVCCYHARHFAIQRFYIEQRLDSLLTRKGEAPNEAIIYDPEIKSLLRKSKGRDIKIIVVATPVEEVGRDHDFDWAILEPSSAQSLVQAGGRVNRHRLIAVMKANIGILQYNFKEVLSSGRICFSGPGYEIRGRLNRTSHSSHDLAQLLNETEISIRFNADVRFNEEKHALSRYDNQSIKAQLEPFVSAILSNSPEWMGAQLYQDTLLRDTDKNQVTWHYEAGHWYRHDYIMNKGVIPIQNDIGFSLSETAGLFTLSIAELIELTERVGLKNKEAFSVTVYASNQPYLMGRFGGYIE